MRFAPWFISLGLAACLCGGPAEAEELAAIDLLALYTPGASARYAGEAETRILHLVGVANQIYEDSGVLLRVRLVHAEEIEYSDSATSSDALHDLTTEGHPLHAQAAALREEHGADLVTLMRPYSNDGYCGLAWLAGRGTNGQLSPRDADYALSHVSLDCSNEVLAHELGHNMGLAHSRRQDPAGGTFSFSAGFGVDQLFTTVMAYQSAFGAPKIYKHSAPTLTCAGVSCGVEAGDTDAGSDAVASLNFLRGQIADYREAATPIDPADFVIGGDAIEPEAVTAAELRILSPKSQRRRIRSGKVLSLEWAESEVATVDIDYRESWSEGSREFIAREWTQIAEGLADGPLAWTVPELPGRKVRLQIRLTGRDALGRAVASHVTRPLRVKRRRR